MAKRSKTTSSKSTTDNKTLMIIILLVVGFAAGFFVARFKYKTQLRRTYDMVMERENKISDLQTQLNTQKMMMEKSR